MRRETGEKIEAVASYIITCSILVAFFAALALLSGCAQVHQETAIVKCVDHPVTQLLPGEAPLNSITAIDVSTRAIPLIVKPHRVLAICGAQEGAASWGMETPAEGGLSEFSDPIQAGVSHFNYGF